MRISSVSAPGRVYLFKLEVLHRFEAIKRDERAIRQTSKRDAASFGKMSGNEQNVKTGTQLVWEEKGAGVFV